MDLSPTLQSQIAQLGARYGAQKIVLFGSRARGDNHPRSDIDLAIYGMPEKQQASFYFAVEEELQTLLKFDLVHITEHTSPALLENIKKEVIMWLLKTFLNHCVKKKDLLKNNLLMKWAYLKVLLVCMKQVIENLTTKH